MTLIGPSLSLLKRNISSNQSSNGKLHLLVKQNILCCLPRECFINTTNVSSFRSLVEHESEHGGIYRLSARSSYIPPFILYKDKGAGDKATKKVTDEGSWYVEPRD